MKSAVNKGGGPLSSTPVLSHIPLPRRKSSSKSDKGMELNDTDSELGIDSMATRSQAKMSLLSGTSFCCASGQKEDYLPEAKIIPPKKRPPNYSAKQVHDASAPNSPLVPPTKVLLRNRRGRIIESTSEDTISQASEIGLVKLSHEDIKIRPPGDSRLRPPDQRGRNAPSSPHRKISRDPLPFTRENSDTRKLSDASRKLRKDSSPRAIPKDGGGGKKSKDNSTSNNCHPKELNSETKSSAKIPSSPKCGKSENNPSVCNGTSNVFHPNGDALEKIDQAKNSTFSVCDASGMLPTSETQDSIDSGVNNSSSFDKSSDIAHLSRQNTQECMDSTMTDSDIMKNSHESEDFDCPCCDRTSTLVDGPMSDSEIHVFTSCEVVATLPQCEKIASEDIKFKELALQSEVKALKEDLQAERVKLKSQQDQVQHLEEELAMMNQLKSELEKEKELRKIAEDKLLEVLDHEKKMETQRRESEKRMESKGTQKDDLDTDASGSPLMMGYESRVRRYQTYITKLEKDNLALVHELKKFKDLSPSSQEDQAKLLLEKLGEIQRNSHQQQLQYESCLDEVANRLVHTLLVQKRLEEECKVLHLRVEQLEQENGTLMELIDDDKNENVIKTVTEEETNLESTSSKVQNKLPSHHPISSTPAKKNSTTRKPSIPSDEKIAEPLKSTNTKYSEPKSPISSPVSPNPKTGCTSKIPAFGSSKPVLRKKSKTESQPAKPRNEIHPSGDAVSPPTVPNLKSPSSIPSSRTKMPSNSDTPKATSVKRKRLSRNGSPAEKSAKDSKQRMKTSHARWEQRRTVPEDLGSCKLTKGDISPIDTFPRQHQVWSFNCEVDNKIPVPENLQKISDSIDAFNKHLDEEGNEQTGAIDKQNFNASDTPGSMEGANRTRDEGYSTMSSDLQPDSAADTTVSEPEHSATYIVTEKELRCVSDDSVTECLDGSMCSSSDSGFGPLHLVANSKSSADLLEEEENKVKELSKNTQDVPRNISTVRHREQIASVKPTIRNNNPPSNLPKESELHGKLVSFCDNFINSDPVHISHNKNSTEELKLSPLKCRNILESIDASLQTSSPQKKFDYTSMLNYWSYPKDILDIARHGKTWHLGSKRSSLDDQIVFCSRNSYIDDNIFDEKVETAEKATLTEPEEAMWREKALAPFIDESIWSLYSSEGDIRVKHFPLEPLLSEPSLDKLITECRPCIIITEDVDGGVRSGLTEFTKPLLNKTSNNSSVADLSDSGEKFRSGLERVASDTVLYLKDAIHELEDSMHRGLKSSKNVSALHNSGSESEASPSGFKPELLLNLETAMLGQSRLVWPSPTRSSSTSSLQSSTSFQMVSDEMDDVDLLRTSRKGSQDPDLSASDAEGENLEHKDFVEQWLQNEVAHSSSIKMVPQLEPVEEVVEFTPPPVRRTSLPLPISPPNLHSRARFMSYPQTSNSFAKFAPNLPKTDARSSATHAEQNAVDCTTDSSNEDVEFNGVDSEAKEFNGDFYKLCSIGSLKSLDHFSPAKSQDAQKKLLSSSPSSNRKTSNLANFLSNCEKPKPTGLVKPTRPFSLPVSSVPPIPDRIKSNSLSPQINRNVSVSTESHQTAKTTQVPRNSHYSPFQKQSSPSSTRLPTAADEQNSNTRSPKVKVPTKIVFKSSASRRRQLARKEASNERQNQLKEGCGTAWIHLQANPELSDPMARISLLDSLKAPSSSSGSSSDEEEEVLVIQTNSHLHRICRERRQKVKASANNPLYDGKKRSSIMGRRELFYRFGDKEKEAMACFDFLEELPTSSIETLNMLNSTSPHELLPIHRTATPPTDLYPAGRETLSNKERFSFLSPTASNKFAVYGNQSSISRSPFSTYRRLRLPNLWNQPLSHNMSSSTLNSQDCELLDHISLSDSCAESYSSTPESYEDAS